MEGQGLRQATNLNNNEIVTRNLEKLELELKSEIGNWLFRVGHFSLLCLSRPEFEMYGSLPG